VSWPPPDPDRIPRRPRPVVGQGDPFTIPHFDSAADELEAFRKRQEEDMARRGIDINNTSGVIRRRKKFHDRYKDIKKSDDKDVEFEGEEEEEENDDGDVTAEEDSGDERGLDRNVDFDEGEEAWRNGEGERLDDFGVDEDVEFYDEEDVPLSVVRERIKAGL
jgi:palmitoyltransferase